MSANVVEARFETLIAQARRLRRKGELKKATTALRQACLLDEERAPIWTLYAALLAGLGKREEAGAAFRHALWLRHRAGDVARERSTANLAASLGLACAA